MISPGKILVTRKRIALAGGIKAALDEAHSHAALQMTPQAMTAYEAVGSEPTVADGSAVIVQIEVRDEQELRESLEAGAEAVLLVDISPAEARRLTEIAEGLRANCVVEISGDESPKKA